MKMTGKRRQLQRGFSLVEVLMAAFLLAVGLMALINMWSFSFQMTVTVDDYGVAYNLGRQAMERVKQSGFTATAEGTAQTYYNANQAQVSSSTARYRVTTYVISSAVSSGTPGQAGAVPTDGALRTVTVTVVRLTDSFQLYQTTTYLVKTGV